MEIFRSNKKNVKIYNKINYIKLLLVFSISFLLFSLFFYYIGREQNLDRSVLTSFAIALLLCVGSIIGDLIDNRSRIFLLNKDKLGYIEIHKDNLGGEYLRENEYFEVVDKYGIDDIFDDITKYEGIDKGIIKEVISLKKKYNRLVVKVKTEAKEWKSSSAWFISKVYLVDKERTRKMIIPNDYNDYVKLYKLLDKMNKKEK